MELIVAGAITVSVVLWILCGVAAFKHHETGLIWTTYFAIAFTILVFFLNWQKRVWERPVTKDNRGAESVRTNEPRPLRALLRPGNEPTPKDLCGGIEDGWIAVTFGSATMTTPKPYQCLLKIDADEVLWFEKTHDGMYVNVIIQDAMGNEVARVTKNAVQVKEGTGYYAEMPDPQTLFILSPDNQKVFYVNYVNPRFMKVLGIFFHHREGPYIIEEGKRPPGIQTDNMCFWLEGGGALMVYDSSDLHR